MSSAQLHVTTRAFQKVDSDASFVPDHDAQFWWRSSGNALAVLLQQAGYSDHAQYKLLRFVRTFTPSLGKAPESGDQKWKSFMTDDHTPIEISWDWGTGDKAPKIRFSIEPIGPYAGTCVDPDNQEGVFRLLDLINQMLPSSHMEWLAHFREQLSGYKATGSIEGHSSKEFYAFDLGENNVVVKAYFFPGYVARRTGKTSLDVISAAIHSAPCSTWKKLEAFRVFQDYVKDVDTPPLEMDMLAIDLLPPAESRFKIYFRIRNCSFESIEKAMTLGNRLSRPETKLGLQRLRSLYHALLSGSAAGQSDDVNSPTIRHRTAGVLYNIEFKLRSKLPKVKVYLPVRHWAESEDAIMSALDNHFSCTPMSTSANFSNYKDAIRTVLYVLLLPS